MQLYWVGDRYVRTQSEAAKLGFGEVTEVPTDKDGLIAFLNDLRKPVEQEVPEAAPPAPEPAKAPVEETSGVLRDCEIEDHIHNATPQRLATLSAAVCWRMKELVLELENLEKIK